MLPPAPNPARCCLAIPVNARSTDSKLFLYRRLSTHSREGWGQHHPRVLSETDIRVLTSTAQTVGAFNFQPSYYACQEHFPSFTLPA